MAPLTVRGVLSLLNVLFVFISGVDFMRFVSFGPIYHNITGETTLCQDFIPWSVALRDRYVQTSLFVDLGLLTLLMVQHSLFAWSSVKQALRLVFGPLNRTVYCFTTALALQILMRCWQPVTGVPCLWSVRHAPWSIWLPLLCFTLHFLCWATIFSTLLLFDFPELLGFKQIYYECFGVENPPSSGTSHSQQHLSHYGPPVILQLIVVLWLLPALSLDRLLMAGILTTYLILGHSADEHDLAYFWSQFNIKMSLFSEPHQGSDDANHKN
ncbi:nurim [Pholidichthys leucotaenia]